jgi:hypothetical protein
MCEVWCKQHEEICLTLSQRAKSHKKPTVCGWTSLVTTNGRQQHFIPTTCNTIHISKSIEKVEFDVAETVFFRSHANFFIVLETTDCCLFRFFFLSLCKRFESKTTINIEFRDLRFIEIIIDRIFGDLCSTFLVSVSRRPAINTIRCQIDIKKHHFIIEIVTEYEDVCKSTDAIHLLFCECAIKQHLKEKKTVFFKKIRFQQE